MSSSTIDTTSTTTRTVTQRRVERHDAERHDAMLILIEARNALQRQTSDGYFVTRKMRTV